MRQVSAIRHVALNIIDLTQVNEIFSIGTIHAVGRCIFHPFRGWQLERFGSHIGTLTPDLPIRKLTFFCGYYAYRFPDHCCEYSVSECWRVQLHSSVAGPGYLHLIPPVGSRSESLLLAMPQCSAT